VAGDNKDVIYLSGKLEEILAGTEPWYSKIILPALGRAVLAGMVFSIAFFTFISGIATIIRPVDEINAIIILNIRLPYILMFIGFVLFILNFYSRAIMEAVFPSAVFEIGAGSQLAARASFTRITLGSTLGLGVVASLIATLLLG
jgi:hypothetical protein